MNVQSKLDVGGAQRLLPFERIALVLQGGGALGAYQAGGVRSVGGVPHRTGLDIHLPAR